MTGIKPVKPFAGEEDYFLFEEKEETRNEYIDGLLFKMNSVSRYHNRITLTLVMMLVPAEKNGLHLFTTSFKVRTPGGNFLYPDILLCKGEPEMYYTSEPVLIIEVLGDDTRTRDLHYKLYEYSKCASLKYYLCIEPETTKVYCSRRTSNNVWVEDIPYTNLQSVINLTYLNLSLSLKDIYNA